MDGKDVTHDLGQTDAKALLESAPLARLAYNGSDGPIGVMLGERERESNVVGETPSEEPVALDDCGHLLAAQSA
jgi:hypothetical protein